MSSRPQIVTTGIVLARTDFQEADRILTILTPDHGKLRVIAKGVRRPRSKLAGGIELLSLSDLTYLPGRGELGTLASSRLITHWGDIMQDVNRTLMAYRLLKELNHATEAAAGEEYFVLLKTALESLNNLSLPAELVALWFDVHLLRANGHALNLKVMPLVTPDRAQTSYQFDPEHMVFRPHSGGPFVANHIKLLRLTDVCDTPLLLAQVQDALAYASALRPLLRIAGRGRT